LRLEAALAATVFAFSMAASPGPNNTMAAASGASVGFVRTLPYMMGVIFGFSTIVLLVGTGAYRLLQYIPEFREGLKWVGAAYLLWLAWRIAAAVPVISEPRSGPKRARHLPALTFFQGALYQFINPKSWLAIIGAVPAYGRATGSPADVVVLAAIFALVMVPTLTFWTMTGVGASRMLRSSGSLRAFNLMMSALLVVSVFSVLLTKP
jgi:threonine/homoserine/homoserine lactone efflux protein